MGSNANYILLFFLFQPLSERHPFHLCFVVWNPHNVQPETQRWAKHPNYRGHSMQVKMKLLVGAQHSRHLDKKTGGHFVRACVNMGCWSATQAFPVNCLRSVPAFVGRFLELNDVYWVQTCIEVFLRWKWVYCSLAVALERTVFPFVKQCLEDEKAAECSYDLTFRAHFLSRRKRSVC